MFISQPNWTFFSLKYTEEKSKTVQLFFGEFPNMSRSDADARAAVNIHKDNDVRIIDDSQMPRARISSNNEKYRLSIPSYIPKITTKTSIKKLTLIDFHFL